MDIYGVVGLGYVGLRTALGLSRHGQTVIGYDIDQNRLQELAEAYDANLDISSEQLKDHTILLTSQLDDLKKATFYIIEIGTPVNLFYVPDMSVLKKISRQLGGILKKNDVIVFESTVYPGATEELFLPLLEECSGLKAGKDFFLGYSPERIVPGDPQHDVTNTKKIVAGQTPATLERIMTAYGSFVEAELVPVSSIKTAEAVKILENIQRDVNIALMNEFAQVMEKLDVKMSEVLTAAATKWNFLPFKPGLVGGHCISVDPYYLIYKARALHVDTDLITTARKVNENFINFIIEVVCNKMIANYMQTKNLNIAILGMTYKKNVSDVRNSLSFRLYEKLSEIGFNVTCHDPIAFIKESHIEVQLTAWDEIQPQQAIIIAIDHDEFKHHGLNDMSSKLLPNGLLFDIPGMFYQQTLPRKDIQYWSL